MMKVICYIIAGIALVYLAIISYSIITFKEGVKLGRRLVKELLGEK